MNFTYDKISHKIVYMDKPDINEILTKGVENIYPSKAEFSKLLKSGKKIRLYQGFDPSMPNLHLGNLVGLVKLRQFQLLGHEVIFLIGDFTGMIGDPTDKSASRKQLTRSQVLENAKNWRTQAGKILDFGGKNPARIMFNSKWGDKISFKNLIEITANFTVQQMLERDFFQKRLQEKRPIYLHEFLYPVAQAIDCVEMEVDLEIGGSDQTFNMLCGRTLMKALKGKEKFVLTTKLLVDNQGQKVGKTTGNALFLNQTPQDIFGGVMSFPDEVMLLSFELLTFYSLDKIDRLAKQLKAGEIKPIDLKKLLAYEITTIIYTEKLARQAEDYFTSVFQGGQKPDDCSVCLTDRSTANIVDILSKNDPGLSRSEIKRLICQRACEVNGEKVNDICLDLKEGDIVKLGKHRFLRIKVK